MNDEEKIQKLYVEFQMLSNAIKQLEKQSEALETQLIELLSTNQSLEEMRKVKPGSEILVPLSSGIYVKAELKESDNFIVNVGSNTALSKDINSTKKIIEEQIVEIRGMQQSLAEELKNNTVKASLIEKEMEKIASELKETN